jgi:hypothetical protein
MGKKQLPSAKVFISVNHGTNVAFARHLRDKLVYSLGKRNVLFYEDNDTEDINDYIKKIRTDFEITSIISICDETYYERIETGSSVYAEQPERYLENEGYMIKKRIDEDPKMEAVIPLIREYDKSNKRIYIPTGFAHTGTQLIDCSGRNGLTNDRYSQISKMIKSQAENRHQNCETISRQKELKHNSGDQPNSEEVWGNVRAEADSNKLFAEDCFVELDTYKNAHRMKNCVIKAFKGAGKSAFIQHLTHCSLYEKRTFCPIENGCPFSKKMCESKNYIIVNVPADDLEVKNIMTTVATIDQTQELQKIFELVFKSYFIAKLIIYFSILNEREAITNIIDFFTPKFQKKLFDTISWIQHENDNATKKLQNLFECDCNSFIRSMIRPMLRSEMSNDLPHEIMCDNIFNEGTFGFQKCYKQCCSLIKIKGIRAIITIDKFDAILEEDYQNRRLNAQNYRMVALSLLTLAIDNFKETDVHYKVLIPEDLYSVIRDESKLDKMTLKWRKTTLKQFLEKRIISVLNCKNKTPVKFLFPEKISNNHYAKSFFGASFLEDIFDYILRHTLYRPRDILRLLKNITREFEYDHPNNWLSLMQRKGFNGQEDVIKRGVKNGTKKIIRELIVEFNTLCADKNVFFQLEEVLSTLQGQKILWLMISFTISLNYYLKNKIQHLALYTMQYKNCGILG